MCDEDQMTGALALKSETSQYSNGRPTLVLRNASSKHERRSLAWKAKLAAERLAATSPL